MNSSLVIGARINLRLRPVKHYSIAFTIWAEWAGFKQLEEFIQAPNPFVWKRLSKSWRITLVKIVLPLVPLLLLTKMYRLILEDTDLLCSVDRRIWGATQGWTRLPWQQSLQNPSLMRTRRAATYWKSFLWVALIVEGRTLDKAEAFTPVWINDAETGESSPPTI